MKGWYFFLFILINNIFTLNLFSRPANLAVKRVLPCEAVSLVIDHTRPPKWIDSVMSRQDQLIRKITRIFLSFAIFTTIRKKRSIRIFFSWKLGLLFWSILKQCFDDNDDSPWTKWTFHMLNIRHSQPIRDENWTNC